MNDDNIIQFPKTRAANKNATTKLESLLISKHHYDDAAHAAIRAMVDSLLEDGYHPLEDRVMIHDLGVILNLVVAMMYRVDGEIHFLHEPMDEIAQVIKYIKELKEKDDLNLFTDDE